VNVDPFQVSMIVIDGCRRIIAKTAVGPVVSNGVRYV
jgi:hypothetical protein